MALHYRIAKVATHSLKISRFTLPALQKATVFLFSAFAWGFDIEKWLGLLVKFRWSCLPSMKSSRQFRRKIHCKIWAKIETFRQRSFCNCSDLMALDPCFVTFSFHTLTARNWLFKGTVCEGNRKFSMKNRPPPLPGASDSHFHSPEQKQNIICPKHPPRKTIRQ